MKAWLQRHQALNLRQHAEQQVVKLDEKIFLFIRLVYYICELGNAN